MDNPFELNVLQMKKKNISIALVMDVFYVEI